MSDMFEKRPLSDYKIATRTNKYSENALVKSKSFKLRDFIEPSSCSPRPSQPPLPQTNVAMRLAHLEKYLPQIHTDFTKPDQWRNRAILTEGRRLYVCEHYISIWSPILRDFLQEYIGLDLPLPHVKYKHFKQMLEVIHPSQKEITVKNLEILLPIAMEFQINGLLYRCEHFLLYEAFQYSLIEKLWLADKYQLSRLLAFCMKTIRPNMERMTLSGPKYHGLSDRVKVMLLERLHGGAPPEDTTFPGQEIERFYFPSETQFGTIKAKTGRTLHINPYYVAIWSESIRDQLQSTNHGELTTGASYEELCAFLKAIHPIQSIINVDNVAPILVSACKLESCALIRRCTIFLLTQAPITVFSKFSLLDRCFLHELLDPCLKDTELPEEILNMTYMEEFHSLSIKAKASLMDRLAVLLKKPGHLPHHCSRCKINSSCHVIPWVCPECGAYCSRE